MLQIGSLVDGKYKILNKIGQGGMSVVYLAMNERANKQWAVKEVRKDGISNFEIVKQGLIVETDLLKKLNHPNLPSIVDVIDTDDAFLIVMDYIEGNPLSKIVLETAAQKQKDVVAWAKQLCDVLSYLHTRTPAIIFRDMKPSNIMLKPDGNVMLIDFGIAREFKNDSVADTTCLGTQGYAAPEQFGGQGQTDPRTDIYCLGATLYHLVTGHNPTEPPYEMYPIREWDPQLSSGLETIIQRCTQRNPQDRYQSCGELMYALEHYQDLDIEVRHKQNRKWWTFVTSVILTVVCVISMLGFKVAENSHIEASYSSYVSLAKQASENGNYDQAAKHYLEAACLNPGNPEAYNNYFDLAIEDQVLTGEESRNLKVMLLYINGNSATNESYFKEANPAAYDGFCYWLGIAYFFNYSGTGEIATTTTASMQTLGNKPKAEKWLLAAAGSKHLESSQIELASRLGTIASHYSSLMQRVPGTGSTQDIVADKTQYSYKDYWNDLVAISGGDVVSATGKISVALSIYQEVVYQVFSSGSKFAADGVSVQAMIEQLEAIELVLNEINAKAVEHRRQIESIIQTAKEARKLIVGLEEER